MRHIFILLALLFSAHAYGQVRVSLEPRLGYGSYAMSDMKAIQADFIRSVGVRARATDQFPAYFQRGLMLSIHLNERNRVSLVFEQGSTGGRVAYEDYSGSVQVDQLLQYTSFGSFFGREQSINGWSILYGLESTIIMSKFRMESAIKIDSYDYYDTEDYRAVGLGTKPMVGIGYHYKRFLPRITAGYLLNHSQKSFYPKDDELSVLTLNNEELAPDWSGFRLTFSVGYTLGKPKE
jgi:hypothetical protein